MFSPAAQFTELSQRSHEQRLQALAQANRVRHLRAEFKRDLKHGRVALSAAIADPPDYLAAARVAELLMALPRYGRVKTTHLLAHCRVSEKKTLAGLSLRQRRELIAALKQ